MRELKVFIEINGESVYVGNIVGNNANDASFTYATDYLKSGYSPISISLPLNKEKYSVQQTRNFFEGLLPEGFTRKTVAGWLHVDENDYLSILAELGRECIGAIRIVEGDYREGKAFYVKLQREQVKALAKEGASKSAELVTKSHLSLTGASGKVGLMYQEGEWYQPVYDAPSTHIVKQSHVRLDSIVLNEQLALMTAKEIGIDVAESFVVDVGTGKDEDVLFASKRYDRLIDERSICLGRIRRPFRLHQEDFGQAMGIPSANKYERAGECYLAGMFDIIRKNSANPIEDGLKLWDITIFDFLIGNTDNHIKNHSLLYSASLSEIRLAPAYDIISTTIYPSSTRDMAFKIGGKYSIDEIDRSAFIIAAKECGIGERIALKHFDNLANQFKRSIERATEKLMSQNIEKAEVLKNRILSSCGYARL